jgi:hypothetical protein
VSPCQALSTRDHGSMGESYSPECVEDRSEGEAAVSRCTSPRSGRCDFGAETFDKLLYADRIAAQTVTHSRLMRSNSGGRAVRPGR